MDRFLDYLIILLLSAFIIFTSQGTITPVVTFLLGLIAGALGMFLDKRPQTTFLCVVFIAISFFLPELSFFFPVILITIYRYHVWWGVVGAIPFLMKLTDYELWETALWAGTCGLSILLTERTNRIETLKRDMISMRDTSTELNLVLREKNKDLMEKQDYEIYLATLKERNRIAREIHDNVGHMLSRSILQIGALKTLHKEEPLCGQLTSINDTLNQAMNSIRESVHDLHDDSIDLRQAVLEATKEMRENYKVQLDYDMSKSVPRNVKYCFIAIIKEAMSNVVKHSNADTVGIILREHPGFYQLLIEDNGTKKVHSTGEGIGLSNMRERVEALNGTIRIQNENGFKLFITIKKEQV